jgi:hypothetical protein
MIDDSTTLEPAADRTPPDVCRSVFDRWRCRRSDGHAGLHESVVGESVTRWNDEITGRRLGDL